MDGREIEIARLNASLAVTRGELKLAKHRPAPRRRSVPWTVVGLMVGAAIGVGLGFTSVGSEQALFDLLNTLESRVLLLLG